MVIGSSTQCLVAGPGCLRFLFLSYPQVIYNPFHKRISYMLQLPTSNPQPLELKRNAKRKRCHHPSFSQLHLPTQLEHVHGHSYTLPCSSVNANYYGNLQVRRRAGGGLGGLVGLCVGSCQGLQG